MEGEFVENIQRDFYWRIEINSHLNKAVSNKTLHLILEFHVFSSGSNYGMNGLDRTVYQAIYRSLKIFIADDSAFESVNALLFLLLICNFIN